MKDNLLTTADMNIRNRPAFVRSPAFCKGITLIELMVTMVVSLMLLAMVGEIFLSSKRVYKVNEGLARVQENARFSIDYLERDIRKAGYTGCVMHTSLANTLKGAAANWSLNLGEAVRGYEGNDADGKTEFPADFKDLAVAGTDAVTVVWSDPGRGYIIDKHNPKAASIHLKANHDLKQGDILVVTDCRHTAVFQMNNTNNNNTISVVDHGTGKSTVPGNCTKGLGSPVDCTSTTGTSYKYEDGAMILRMQASAFFIGNGAGGGPSLFRLALSGGGGTGAEELVEGVENLQILFGVDADASHNGTPEKYLTANQVTDWDEVTSVRLSLLLRSRSDNLSDINQTYNFNGADVKAADKRVRKTVDTTVSLRNRLP